MSNHIDPKVKVQEIEQRLDFVNGLLLTGWVERTLRDDAAYLLSEYKRLQTAATNAIEVLELIKKREMDAYKYETDVYLDAVSALSHLKGE